MDIDAYVKAIREKVETCLDALVSAEAKMPYQRLIKAARYSLLGSGKRLRPILAIAAAESLGCPGDKALRAACALEMVHTYSLIHDDLPCMDDDDLRRGKPTLHKAFPESHAVLAGDYLLTLAFEVLSSDPTLSDEEKVKLINLLAKSAGSSGMIGGQIMDIESETKQVALDMLQWIHRQKTGAMITASIEFGGIIAGADGSMLETLRTFGQDLGLAFQIVDDVLDVTSTRESLGKTAASDITNNKATYVTVLGLEQAKATAQSHYASAVNTIEGLNFQPPILKYLASLLVNRDK